jgi:hypothetical protein|tara:strand:- start:6849 stop:7082 length:234 start_codon:yes stop_codon:yes gene_type:complete
MPVMNQNQMFYQASRDNAELDTTFLELVEGGMTREELQANIDRRPALWGRWSSWLDKLPTSKQLSQSAAEADHTLSA